MPIIKYLLVAVTATCLMTAPVALGAICEGDKLAIPDAIPIDLIRALAEAGDMHAQTTLGFAYLHGKGPVPDYGKAFEWLEKSAAAGDSEGQYILGQTYLTNGKTEADYSKAAALFKKSADQGCIPAELYLGLHQLRGLGVPKSIPDGVEKITHAAESGYPVALVTLGMLYRQGEGVNKDMTTGFDWIKKAADSGDSFGQIVLANVYLEASSVNRNTDLGRELLEKVFRKNDEQSMNAAYFLGYMYMDGKTMPTDNAKALKWMLIAANASISNANSVFAKSFIPKIVEKLPRKELKNNCSVYQDSEFVAKKLPESLQAMKGETVILLESGKNFMDVYFPDRQIEGFIMSQCLAH